MYLDISYLYKNEKAMAPIPLAETVIPLAKARLFLK